MAKGRGKQFEEDFKSSVPYDILIYRYKDGTSSWGNNMVCHNCKTPIESNTRFQAKNKCDYELYKFPNVFYLELKSTKGASFSYSMVRDNQVKELTIDSKHKGVFAGIIINFSEHNETYFLDIKLYNSCVDTLERKSIPISFFREHAILIKQEQKRVNWRYDIHGFINQLRR